MPSAGESVLLSDPSSTTRDGSLGAADLRLDRDARERLEAAGHRADHWEARAPTPTG